MDISRLSSLRNLMVGHGIDVYIVPTSDFHSSEYVGDFFKTRQFITGFTGSAGTAVVTAGEAGLWTDGRYFIQAAAQIEGSGFKLFKMGVDGVPKVEDFVGDALPEGGVIGFDGRVMNAADAEKFKKIAAKKGGSLRVDEDLVGMLWEDRPPMACSTLWILTEKYSGESAASKMKRIRDKMKEEGADIHVVASLYDIAWILNLRGDDIANVPVFMSFLKMDLEGATLYVQPDAMTDEVGKYLADCGVAVADYGDIYADLAKIPAGTKVLMDRQIVNCRMETSLGEGVEIIDKADPSELMKAVKNGTELANTRIAHLKDGVVMTKFMYWLKTNVGKIDMDEYSVGAYLDGLRRGQEHFLDLSFDDICAYGPNAAMMHYAAPKEGAAKIYPEGMLLVDSGGHYLEGTTDITRTFILGPITDAMRMYFTTVCKCNLRLANVKFLSGCSGLSLDAVCREPLWEMGMDYRCGTGHGVGHILNVHEGPNGFRYKTVPERRDGSPLAPGMVTTDEPGVYVEGAYGIRTENELVCVEDEKNEYGQFLRFENITYCPIDLDGIDPDLLGEKGRAQLNAYHRMVWEKVSPYLAEDERAWLKEYTREI